MDFKELVTFNYFRTPNHYLVLPCCCDELQVLAGTFKVVPLEKQVQMLKELSAHKGWNPGRDLKRLQQRVQKILNNWTDLYRSAMGN